MPELSNVNSLKVTELRAELKARGLGAKGNKQVLAEKLKSALLMEASSGPDGEAEEQAGSQRQLANQELLNEGNSQSSLASHDASQDWAERDLASHAAAAAAWQLVSRAPDSAGPLASHVTRLSVYSKFWWKRS